MTDHIDYTVLPEVLEACGFVYWEDNTEGLRIPHWSRKIGAADSAPTMQELWEGLCKAWEERWIDPLDDEAEELLRKARPALQGLDCVVLWEPGETHFFRVKDYGTLSNAIAAALYTVLQQGEKGSTNES